MNKVAAVEQESSISGTDFQVRWPKNTVLIARDRMLLNFHENTLRQQYSTKVRCSKVPQLWIYMIV